VRLEEFFGAKDFIANDPRETVANILRNKSKHGELEEIFKKAENADILIIHGEGDLVFTTPPRREALYLLGMAELGLQLNKTVVFANGLVSDCPSTGRNVETLGFARNTLSRCDALIVRDYQSLEFVRTEMPEANCSLVPDSLFTWYPIIENAGSEIPANGDFIIPYPENKNSFGKLDFSMPYICIGGSALAAKDKKRSAEHFSLLVEKAKGLGYPVYLTENCGGDSFLQKVAAETGVGLVPVETAIFMGGAILANARLFISGRYHPSILASLGGTPCIFLGSSAHKMHSLQKVLGYENPHEFSVYPSGSELEEILEMARDYLDQGESLRMIIKANSSKRCAEALRLPAIIHERVIIK
jgi:polysaccharide pyruvyl transferase WcaK-like protein